jgi:hypothetical protein
MKLIPDRFESSPKGGKAEAAFRQRIRADVLVPYEVRLETVRGLRRALLLHWIEWKVSLRMNEMVHVSPGWPSTSAGCDGSLLRARDSA